MMGSPCEIGSDAAIYEIELVCDRKRRLTVQRVRKFYGVVDDAGQVTVVSYVVKWSGMRAKSHWAEIEDKNVVASDVRKLGLVN
jgi:hypothetical protein